MMNFRQIQAFVAVYEESSFSRAAERQNATQSGLSMQIQNLENALDMKLFERTSKGVIPTQAGQRLYRRATAILRSISEAEAELGALAKDVTGQIRIGLMPTFSHSVLSPALSKFIRDYPNVDITIEEAFSPALSEGVAKSGFDFAIVPVEPERSGVQSSPFGSDWELLVSAPDSPLGHLEPVELSQLNSLKLILPTRGNARRERLELFFASNEIDVDAVLEMNAMVPALELVGSSNWMTILPATICSKDVEGIEHKLHPIVRPRATIDYILIEPSRQSLSPSARLFLATLREEFDKSHDKWMEILGNDV